jgi:hypothetical protein
LPHHKKSFRIKEGEIKAKVQVGDVEELFMGLTTEANQNKEEGNE